MSKNSQVLSPAPAATSRRELFGLPRAPQLTSAALLSAAVTTAVQSAQAASTDKNNDIIYMSATKLAGLIRSKKVSALEAVDAYIARQLKVNDLLNAVVMNSYERARTEAKALDSKAAKGQWAGPLHGVPMTIKDSLDTEGVITTGATFGRQQYVPEKDATVVARLRKVGAILLGKTNTPEFTLGG